MSEHVYTEANEHPLLKFDAIDSGCSSAPVGIFNLRRRDYFNKTRFNGTERRVSRTVIAKERRKPPLYEGFIFDQSDNVDS